MVNKFTDAQHTGLRVKNNTNHEFCTKPMLTISKIPQHNKQFVNIINVSLINENWVKSLLTILRTTQCRQQWNTQHLVLVITRNISQ